MDSKMLTFYKNKTIFITGGSGFLGRVTIEKLLRTTDVKRIYVLIRPKKGMEIQKRIAGWASDPLFSVLAKSKANFLDRVFAIAGDCEMVDLGIHEADRKLLLAEVHIVVHSAATVNFMEPLNVALNINTRAARVMLQLAKQMSHLEAFVHVSTAYSNCVIEHIEERFYPEHLSCSFDKLLALKDLLSKELIDGITPTLLGKFPNTYTYTKALGEQVVQVEACDLPICIFRPAMILPTYKEPITGWSDNLFGPISVLLACGFGILRIMLLKKNARAHIIPVDYCANIILSSAWHTAVEAAQRKEGSVVQSTPPIYNYVPSERNLLKWGGFTDVIDRLKHKYPLEQMIWYPFINTTTLHWLYNIAIIIYHLLPACIIDMILVVKGQKPRMLKLYGKIHRNVKRLSPFSLTDWTFDTQNTDRLVQCLSPHDRKLFEFDMSYLNWEEYFNVAICGMREFLANEKPTEESFRKSKKVFKRFALYHRILQLTLCCIAAAVIWRVLTLLIDAF